MLSFVEIPHRKEIDRFQIPVHRDDLDLHGLAKLEFLSRPLSHQFIVFLIKHIVCLLYTSDAADEEDSVDLGGRRIINKKKTQKKKKEKVYISHAPESLT